MGQPWNYIQHGKPQGPVTEEEMKQLLGTGQVPWEGMVWRPGLKDWIKASQAPELQPTRSGLPGPPAADPEGRSPFEPPRADVQSVPEPTSLEARAAVAGALEALRATRPWARFLGVLGLIGIVLMGLLAILMASLSRGPFRGVPPFMRVVLPLAYVLMAAIQIPPVVFLNRYASRIGALLKSQAPEDLARALEAQKAFWRYVGILVLVVTCIYAFVIVIAGGTALVAGLGRHFRP